MPKVVLTIGGSDSGGGAGIQADIKTFSALGLHGTSVITAITAQNTLGVQSVFGIQPEAVTAQLVSVTDDFHIQFAKTGMLYSAEIVKTVAVHLAETKIPLVLDPVIEAEAGGRLLRPDAVIAVKKYLIPLAHVVTPNIFEAQALTGISVKDAESAELAARKILDLGAKAVMIKGGHLDCTDFLLEDNELLQIHGKRSKGGNHGVGCTYSAALTSFLAKGYSLKQAAAEAQKFAAQAISNSLDVGRGVGPVSQIGNLLKEAYRFRAISDIQKAIEQLKSAKADIEHIIPKTGSSICEAIPEAASLDDIAEAEVGIIHDAGAGFYQFGCIKFGEDSLLSRIILEVMSTNAHARSAMLLNGATGIFGLKPICINGQFIPNFFATDDMVFRAFSSVPEKDHYADIDTISRIGNKLGQMQLSILIGASATDVAATVVSIALPSQPN